MRPLVLSALLFGFLSTIALAAEPDPLLPDDTEIVATLHLRQLAEAPLVKQHFPAGLGGLIAKDSAWGRLTRTLGVDLADVKTITYARPASLDPGRGLLILRSASDFEKAYRGLIKQADQEPDRVKMLGKKRAGPTYFRIEDAEPARWSVYVGLGEKGTLVLSEQESSVVGALARSQDSRQELSAALKKQLA